MVLWTVDMQILSIFIIHGHTEAAPLFSFCLADLIKTRWTDTKAIKITVAMAVFLFPCPI